MKKEDLKKGIVYFYDGTCGADGANILFSPKENNSFDYQGSIILHWSGNTINIDKKPNGFGINQGHLKTLSIASDRATKYYYECAKLGKDTGKYNWHQSNEDKL